MKQLIVPSILSADMGKIAEAGTRMVLLWRKLLLQQALMAY